MCINVLYIFVIGDIVGNLMLVYKVMYEGKLVVEVVVGYKKEWVVWVILLVVYINLEIVWVGVIEIEVKVKGLKVGVVKFLWVVSGCVIGIGCIEGFIKLIFDEEIYCIIGGVIVGVYVGDLLVEIGLVIEMGVEVEDIGYIIYVYLMLSELVVMVLEIYDGMIIDLYMLKKK